MPGKGDSEKWVAVCWFHVKHLNSKDGAKDGWMLHRSCIGGGS